MMNRACLAALALCTHAALAQTKVELPSLDTTARGDPVPLVAHWFVAPANEPRPAVVLLHGCGGAYDARGRLSARMREYARLFRAEGWHALVLDSLESRGEHDLCTQRPGERKVTMANRRLDAIAALRWLQAQPRVDAARIALLGWSNGGSAVLAATNRQHAGVRRHAAAPRAAVAYYPGCEAELKRGYAASAPLLLLLGENDDWTTAQPCIDLARQASGEPRPRVEVYAGAFHGFDSRAPLRLRGDVPGGVNPGQGVTVGGDPAVRAASLVAMLSFLRGQFR